MSTPTVAHTIEAIHPPTGTRGLFTVRADSSDTIVVRESWEENIYHLSSRWDGACILDLGANIGAFSVLAGKLGADVVAVEPQPDNYSHLTENLSLNGLSHDRVRALPVACWKHSDGVTISGEHGGTCVDTQGTHVPTLTLGELVEAAGRQIDLMKVDVEGSEYAILRDTEPLARIDRIVMEFHATTSAIFGELVSSLTEWGHVETLGARSRGGMIYARRYGA